VSLLLNWKPNGLHAPYYAAVARGFYTEAGVEVADMEAGQGSDFSAKQVGLGNAAVGVSSADQVLTANDRGLSPTAVAAVMQRTPVVVFTTRAAFGGDLDGLAQLAGSTVGTGPGMVRTVAEVALERAGVRDRVTLADAGHGTVEQLLAGEYDAAAGVFGDVVDARHQGATVSSVPASRHVSSYGHVVAASPGFIDEHPDALRGFLRATARGAAWAHRNPERAVDALLDRVPALSGTRAAVRDEWARMAGGYVLSEPVRERGWGWSRPGPWRETARLLVDSGVLDDGLDPGSAWTNDYLDLDDRYVGGYADAVDGAEP
jgi:NitT/TauT family transport system substrate-binding protein